MSGFIDFFFSFYWFYDIFGQQTSKLGWFHNNWKTKSWNPLSARLYQGAGAELEAEREVHSRGSAAQRVTRKVSNLVIEFHVCQPRFQVFCQYLSKNAENWILRRNVLGKNTIKKKEWKISRALLDFSRAEFLIFFTRTNFIFTGVNFWKFSWAKNDFHGYFFGVFHLFSRVLFSFNSQNPKF